MAGRAIEEKGERDGTRGHDRRSVRAERCERMENIDIRTGRGEEEKRREAARRRHVGTWQVEELIGFSLQVKWVVLERELASVLRDVCDSKNSSEN